MFEKDLLGLSALRALAVGPYEQIVAETLEGSADSAADERSFFDEESMGSEDQDEAAAEEDQNEAEAAEADQDARMVGPTLQRLMFAMEVARTDSTDSISRTEEARALLYLVANFEERLGMAFNTGFNTDDVN